ncbi:MAG TPA: alpha/beta hydrolase [Candidatus Stackebrandtia faecavium]|nr:alpha/beta hydrolase [Candidatus Stackebrandtia faecavium]
MTDFVLIPGEWMGAWIWDVPRTTLDKSGHNAYGMTLTGLAEETDESCDHIRLETHVQDVVRLLEHEGLTDAVLVAHGYAGIVAGIVAGRVPERVRHTVFVDAFLPVEGKSMFDLINVKSARIFEDMIEQNNGWWPKPSWTDFTQHGMPIEREMWLGEHVVPHPGRTVRDEAYVPKPMHELSATYIKCTQPYGELYSDEVQALRDGSAWQFLAWDLGHWPMAVSPTKLAFFLMNGIAYQ